MLTYVVAHWRGKLSLGISFFLNALLAYVILVYLLVEFGRILPGGFAVWLGTIIFVLWFVWAIVGTVRCALRTLRENTYGRWTPALAGLVLVLMAIVILLSLQDLGYLVL